jgi:hypothetical protein
VTAVSIIPLHNRKFLVRLTLGLTLYLLLFSAFALYHAYANNELIDPHGCQVGLWVQHGQTAVIGLALLAVSLAVVLLLREAPSRYVPQFLLFGLSARAPPLALR